ncbi:MAG: hypothetical protein FJ109_09895 [Deltaproteobacteria bacterium]|nr:hypothetical protein [Deltaproteobacteria bacterium]
MKCYVTVTSLLFACLLVAFQLLCPPSVFAAPGTGGKAPGPCGSALLKQLNPVLARPYLGPVPGGRGFPTVGETRKFWTYDLSVMPPKNIQVAATCRGVGANVAVWVADKEWEKNVAQADVDAILAAMEQATPRTSDSGVIANNEALFGPPPKFHEDDPDLTLLVYDIPNYKQYSFDGFFRREDLAPFNPSCANNPMLYCSNELGMIHVKAEDVGGEYMQGVIAHEYEHLAHFGRDPNEESWLDETLAELAMSYSGYEDPGNVNAYLKQPSLALVMDPPVNYGACFVFGGYLYQRLGVDGINALVASATKGIAAIDEAESHGGFEPMLGEYAAANILDDTSVADGQFGYDLFDLGKFASNDFGNYNGKDFIVQPTGLHYFDLAMPLVGLETYKITFDAKGTSVRAHAVHVAGPAVYPLTPGESVTLPVLEQPILVLALANPDPDAKATVSISVEVVQGELPVVEEPVAEEPVMDDVVAQADGSPEPVADAIGSVDQVPSAESEADVAAGDVGKTTDDGKKDGGCQAGTSPSAASAFLLLLLAGVLFLRRNGRTS